MVRWISLLAIILLACCLYLEGCRRGEPAKKETSGLSLPCQKSHTRVFVPQEVENQWDSVQITLQNRTTGYEDRYTVRIGSEFKLSNTDLTIHVEHFLPAFVMNGTTITSDSNETRNPAAYIVVRQGNEELFRGWLFSLYPEACNFEHPEYRFMLTNYTEATQKRG